MHLQRAGDQLTVTLGEQTVSVPITDMIPDASTWQRIYDDAVAYGRELFDRTFRDEQMRTLLAKRTNYPRIMFM